MSEDRENNNIFAGNVFDTAVSQQPERIRYLPEWETPLHPPKQRRRDLWLSRLPTINLPRPAITVPKELKRRPVVFTTRPKRPGPIDKSAISSPFDFSRGAESPGGSLSMLQKEALVSSPNGSKTLLPMHNAQPLSSNPFNAVTPTTACSPPSTPLQYPRNHNHQDECPTITEKTVTDDATSRSFSMTLPSTLKHHVTSTISRLHPPNPDRPSERTKSRRFILLLIILPLGTLALLALILGLGLGLGLRNHSQDNTDSNSNTPKYRPDKTPSSSSPSSSTTSFSLNNLPSSHPQPSSPSSSSRVVPSPPLSSSSPPPPSSPSPTTTTTTSSSSSSSSYYYTTLLPLPWNTNPDLKPPYTGNLTLFDLPPVTGSGACGLIDSDSTTATTDKQLVCGVSHRVFDAAGEAFPGDNEVGGGGGARTNPNENILCGRRIRVWRDRDENGNGSDSGGGGEEGGDAEAVVVVVRVVDRCVGCGAMDLDLSRAAFEALGEAERNDNGDGKGYGGGGGGRYGTADDGGMVRGRWEWVDD